MGLCPHGDHIPPSRKKYFSIFSQYMIRYGILSVPNDFLDRFQTREVVRNDLGHDSDDITRENFFGLGGGSHTWVTRPPSPLEGGTPCVRV